MRYQNDQENELNNCGYLSVVFVEELADSAADSAVIRNLFPLLSKLNYAAVHYLRGEGLVPAAPVSNH